MHVPTLWLILNSPGGCKDKIYSMTSCHVKFVITAPQFIQYLQHDNSVTMKLQPTRLLLGTFRLPHSLIPGKTL